MADEKNAAARLALSKSLGKGGKRGKSNLDKAAAEVGRRGAQALAVATGAGAPVAKFAGKVGGKLAGSKKGRRGLVALFGVGILSNLAIILLPLIIPLFLLIIFWAALSATVPNWALEWLA